MGQKRGEGDFFAFAAFFSAKGAVATALWAVLPVRKVVVSTTGHRPGGYRSREGANARVNDPAEQRSNSYQGNIAFQKSDQKKRSDCYPDSSPVNQRFGN